MTIVQRLADVMDDREDDVDVDGSKSEGDGEGGKRASRTVEGSV